MKPLERNSPVQFFTYQWSPVTDRPQEMDWITLTEQTNFPEGHIFVHQLTRRSDLQFIAATLDSGSAAGLLLINSKESYTVGDRVFPQGEGWTVPIMVVTQETGKKIRSVLSSHSCGVEARVKTISQESCMYLVVTVLLSLRTLHYTYCMLLTTFLICTYIHKQIS